MNKSCPCCGYPFDETEAKTGGWISVNERLPADGDEVLIWCGWIDVGFCKDISFYVDDGVNQAFHVTHWMSLPSIEGLENG